MNRVYMKWRPLANRGVNHLSVGPRSKTTNPSQHHPATRFSFLLPNRDALLNRVHIVQSLLHLVQVIVSYVLMLIVMTYNYWLCLSVVLGAMFGYYAFGWVRNSAVDPTEHCN